MRISRNFQTRIWRSVSDWRINAVEGDRVDCFGDHTERIRCNNVIVVVVSSHRRRHCHRTDSILFERYFPIFINARNTVAARHSPGDRPVGRTSIRSQAERLTIDEYFVVRERRMDRERFLILLACARQFWCRLLLVFFQNRQKTCLFIICAFIPFFSGQAKVRCPSIIVCHFVTGF